MLGKSKTRNIRVLDAKVLAVLDLARPLVYLPEQQARQWKDRLEQYVRQACDRLDIKRRGVHGFRATVACQFVDAKCALGFADSGAQRELAMRLRHNPQRTKVTYAYMLKPKGVQRLQPNYKVQLNVSMGFLACVAENRTHRGGVG